SRAVGELRVAWLPRHVALPSRGLGRRSREPLLLSNRALGQASESLQMPLDLARSAIDVVASASAEDERMTLSFGRAPDAFEALDVEEGDGVALAVLPGRDELADQPR